MTVLVRAQGKVNLRLAVLAREASGYHSIETIFHKIALADDVAVTLRPPHICTVRCSVDVGPMEENLAYRAALAYLARSGWKTGFEIAITKRIPAGGGLGGGSADAAAVLRALNDLAPQPLDAAVLLQLAAELGADVPFLASDAAMALAWGRGERLLALDPLPQRTIALVTPGFRVATAEAYGWLGHGTTAEGYAPRATALRYWHLANWEEIVPWASNDFERAVGVRFPEVGRLTRSLRAHGATIAQLTGSGSTVFGVFDTPPEVRPLELATGHAVLLTRSAAGVEAVQRID